MVTSWLFYVRICQWKLWLRSYSQTASSLKWKRTNSSDQNFFEILKKISWTIAQSDCRAWLGRYAVKWVRSNFVTANYDHTESLRHLTILNGRRLFFLKWAFSCRTRPLRQRGGRALLCVSVSVSLKTPRQIFSGRVICDAETYISSSHTPSQIVLNLVLSKTSLEIEIFEIWIVFVK